MGYLWSLEDLERWCKSSHKDVRLWAAHRLVEHFSEQAKPLMGRLLQDSDEKVVFRAAKFFEQNPSQEFAEPLLAVIREGRTHLLEPCAMALAKLGDRRFVPFCLPVLGQDPGFERFGLWMALAEVRSAEALEKLQAGLDASLSLRELPKRDDRALGAWRGQIERGVDLLLQWRSLEDIERLLRGYLASPQREALGWTGLAAFADRGGAHYSEDELNELMAQKVKRGLSALGEELLDLVDVFGDPADTRSLTQLLKARNYTEVITLAHRRAESLRQEAAEHWGGTAVAAWEQGPSEAAFNLRALRVLKRQIPLLGQREKPVQHRLALLAMIHLTQLLPQRDLLGCPLESAETDFLLEQLLEERPDSEEDERLIIELGLRKLPASAADTCLEVVAEWDHSAVWRAARLLGQMKHEPAIPALLELVEHEDDKVWQQTHDALKCMGTATIKGLCDIDWEASKYPDSLADLLADLPFSETEELVLQNFERLRETASEAWGELLHSLGSRRLVEPLKAVLKPGEPEVAAYVLLCHLHGYKDSRLPEFERTLEENEHRETEHLLRVSQGDMRALVRKTLSLRLQCLKCRQTFNYEVREVFVDPEQKSLDTFHIPERVACKECGAASQFELTDQARWSITSELMLQLAIAETGQGDPDESPVKVRVMQVDGKSMTPLQGKTYYEEKLAAHPDRVDWRIGYAN
ncbi:MAG: hypothetical protein L0312_14450, partial [Acidobacteria bacterium]|nr:hypothetical protein [Acidobacteriota bacterium]